MYHSEAISITPMEKAANDIPMTAPVVTPSTTITPLQVECAVSECICFGASIISTGLGEGVSLNRKTNNNQLTHNQFQFLNIMHKYYFLTNLIILKVSRAFGISSAALEWICNYLTDRSQCISTGSSHSQLSTCASVFQTRVIPSQILFILHVVLVAGIISAHSNSHHQ